jgi:hypothetical protein
MGRPRHHTVPGRPGIERAPAVQFPFEADRALQRYPARSIDVQTQEMISTHPSVRGNVNAALIAAIDAAYACAQTCTSCADACLAEEMVADLRQCIRYNLDCADVCAATAALANRRTGSDEEVIRKMLDACVTACRLCGAECEAHGAKMEHCRICAEACRACESACREALRSM